MLKKALVNDSSEFELAYLHTYKQINTASVSNTRGISYLVWLNWPISIIYTYRVEK